VKTARNFLERRLNVSHGRRGRTSLMRTTRLTAVEIGTAEVLDTLVARIHQLGLALDRADLDSLVAHQHARRAAARAALIVVVERQQEPAEPAF
jgi:hypothetical protein